MPTSLDALDMMYILARRLGMQAINLWVENMTASNVILTDLLIKEKARIFANAFNIQENELVFSNGWLQKFKKRNNIRRYRIHGESGSAPLASLPEEWVKLRKLLSRFTLDQIYNMDETVRCGFIFYINYIDFGSHTVIWLHTVTPITKGY